MSRRAAFDEGSGQDHPRFKSGFSNALDLAQGRGWSREEALKEVDRVGKNIERIQASKSGLSKSHLPQLAGARAGYQKHADTVSDD